MRKYSHLREGNRAPQHAGNTLTSGKGIGPYSIREILSLREGSRAPQQAGNILTSGKGIGPYSRLIVL